MTESTEDQFDWYEEYLSSVREHWRARLDEQMRASLSQYIGRTNTETTRQAASADLHNALLPGRDLRQNRYIFNYQDIEDDTYVDEENSMATNTTHVTISAANATLTVGDIPIGGIVGANIPNNTTNYFTATQWINGNTVIDRDPSGAIVTTYEPPAVHRHICPVCRRDMDSMLRLNGRVPVSADSPIAWEQYWHCTFCENMMRPVRDLADNNDRYNDEEITRLKFQQWFRRTGGRRDD